MPTYQTKPKPVHALQWFPGILLDEEIEVRPRNRNGSPEQSIYVDLGQGILRVEPGDWLVTEQNGEGHIYTDDGFHQNFVLLEAE